MAKINKRNGVFSVIDLNKYGLKDVPADRRADVKEEVGEYILSKIKKSLRNTSSPVSGEKWSPLSKDYKKEKRGKGGGTAANLRLTGSMLKNLVYKPGTKGDLKIGVETSTDRSGRSNVKKALGHNHFERGATSPRRRFLPGAGQKFKKEIEAGIKDIVQTSQELDLSQVDTDVLSVADLIAAGTVNREAVQELTKVQRQNLLDLVDDDDLASII